MELPAPPPLPGADLDGNALPKAIIGSRDRFPLLKAPIYLNHAAVSPLSVGAVAAMDGWARDLASHGVDAFGRWMAQRERLRARLAAMFGVNAEDLALTAGTTRGVLDVAWCLDWKAGDRVILFEGEFPANVTPWQQAAKHFDLRPEFLSLDGFGDGSGAGLARLEAALQGGARLVAVSAVQFQTGLRMPLAAMAELCHRHGAELFVDGIQACGMVPLDLAALGVDYLACGGHKWLMGPEGCGFLYVSPQAIDHLKPRMAGWLSHDNGLGFLFEGEGHLRYDRPVRRAASFLEPGASPSAGMAALEASVTDIHNLDQHAIFAHVQAWHDAVEPGLLDLGFRSLRGSDPGARSGSLCLKPPADVDVVKLLAPLAAEGVSCAIPDGCLRLAPHWPNALSEAPRVLAAAAAALATVRRP